MSAKYRLQLYLAKTDPRSSRTVSLRQLSFLFSLTVTELSEWWLLGICCRPYLVNHYRGCEKRAWKAHHLRIFVCNVGPEIITGVCLYCACVVQSRWDVGRIPAVTAYLYIVKKWLWLMLRDGERYAMLRKSKKTFYDAALWHRSSVITERNTCWLYLTDSVSRLYTVNHKTWHFIFDYNFG